MGLARSGDASLRIIEVAVISVLVVLAMFGKTSAVGSRLATRISSDRLGTSADFFGSTIARYMREMKNGPSVVHLIVQADSNRTKKFGASIVEGYSKYGVPLMSFLNNRANMPIETVADPRRRCPTCQQFRHVIGIFESPEDVRPEEWKTSFEGIWNPGAYFAVMMTEGVLGSIDRQRIDALLRLFWAADCANVVIACVESSAENDTIHGRIFAYDPSADGWPFSPIGNNGPTGKTYLVESADSPLFPEKLKNLRGKIIATSLYSHSPHASLADTRSLDDATGFDTEILRYASKRLNFSIRLVSGEADATSHMIRLPCGRMAGPIGDVLTGKSEYLANGQFLETFNLYNGSLDFVYPRWRSRSVVLVRRKPPMPAALVRWSRSVTAPNDRHVKRLLLLIGGLAGLASIIIYLRVLKRRTGGETFLAVIELALFQHLPKIGWLASERIFTIAWIYGSFVLCTVYQGSLVNDLTSPPIYDDIDTLGELVERVQSLRLIVRPYERRILERRGVAANEHENEVEQSLLQHAQVQLNFSACLALMRQSRDVACSIDESFGEYALGQVRRYELMLEKDPHTRVVGLARDYLLPPIHILDESLVSFWKTYLVRRDLPYLDLLDETIGRAVEFGLTEKWLRDDRNSRFREPEPASEPVSIGLSHMDYTFALLAIGHLVAVITFLAEIFFASVRTRTGCVPARRQRSGPHPSRRVL